MNKGGRGEAGKGIDIRREVFTVTALVVDAWFNLKFPGPLAVFYHPSPDARWKPYSRER